MDKNQVENEINNLKNSLKDIDGRSAQAKQIKAEIKELEIDLKDFSSKEIFTIPDFDEVLGGEDSGELDEKDIGNIVDNIHVESDEEGNQKIHLTSLLSNTSFINNLFIGIENKLYDNYLEKTGKELWNPKRRAMEREFYLMVVKMNISSIPLAISPLQALILMSGYMYVLPTFKLISSKKEIKGVSMHDGKQEESES